jgi:UDPglucose 6-dehydrogenase
VRIVVIGAGYVGLNCGAAFAYLGHDVGIVEKDPARVALLRSGGVPIHEPGLAELLAMPQVAARMTYTTDLAEVLPGARVALIAVGTPPGKHGQADTGWVEAAAEDVARDLAVGAQLVIVVKSTVPVGTNHRVQAAVARVLASRGVTCDVSFASNPEFLREGKALLDMFYPDRILVGSESSHALETARELYQEVLTQSFAPPPSCPRPIGFALPAMLTTSTASAEMTKYASNAFLATKISFINEIAGLCERVGADVSQVADGMGLDARIGRGFLQAGLGWGGSCFPKDTQALIAMGADHEYTMPLLEASTAVNRRQRAQVVQKLQRALRGLRGREVGLLGLAFKAGTDDVRQAPAADLVQMLLECGAFVRAHDPVAADAFRRDYPSLDVTLTPDAEAAARGADALVVCTDWPEYVALDWRAVAAAMRGSVVVDGRNCLPMGVVRAAGLDLIRIGK